MRDKNIQFYREFQCFLQCFIQREEESDTHTLPRIPVFCVLHYAFTAPKNHFHSSVRKILVSSFEYFDIQLISKIMNKYLRNNLVKNFVKTEKKINLSKVDRKL
jgi:hypothetical protein